jgi:hypothetical protein
MTENWSVRPMTTADRTGFVRFQQRLARMALERGELGAARAALRVLRPSDFAGGAAVCEEHLAVLREQRSGDTETRRAIEALVALRAAGSGPAP